MKRETEKAIAKLVMRWYRNGGGFLFFAGAIVRDTKSPMAIEKLCARADREERKRK